MGEFSTRTCISPPTFASRSAEGRCSGYIRPGHDDGKGHGQYSHQSNATAASTITSATTSINRKNKSARGSTISSQEKAKQRCGGRAEGVKGSKNIKCWCE